MAFTITARFLLHTYQGADGTGKPERYPSPERLYKALVATAYGAFGFGSAYAQRESQVSDRQLEAVFRWLESNPPDAIRLPRASRRNGSGAIVYRDKGSRKKAEARDVKDAPAVCSTAYLDTDDDGDLIWQWKTEPEPAIADLLARLCREVPYLGEACSPVALTAETILDDEFPVDADRSLVAGDDDLSASHMAATIEFEVPGEGHLLELQRGYATAYPRKVTAPKGTEDEKTILPNTLTACVRGIGYRRMRQAATVVEPSPWRHGFVIPATLVERAGGVPVDGEADGAWQPDESTLVAWAVALHRMLVRQWGYDVSPMLTGRYAAASTTSRPANNVAIQVLTEHMPVCDDLRGHLPGFLVMVPHDMPLEEVGRLAAVCAALRGQKLYYSHHASTIRLGAGVDVDLGGLWQPVRAGCRRLWAPYPLCIRETRGFRTPAGSDRRWSVRDGMALSIAHVWRDRFAGQQDDAVGDGTLAVPSGVGKDAKYWRLAGRVTGADSGVHIYDAHTETRTPMTDYVHKTQPGNLLMGMTALLSFDESQWAVERSAMAIGQSRHLGGGFLIPVDVATQLIDKDGKPTWVR